MLCSLQEAAACNISFLKLNYRTLCAASHKSTEIPDAENRLKSQRMKHYKRDISVNVCDAEML